MGSRCGRLAGGILMILLLVWGTSSAHSAEPADAPVPMKDCGYGKRGLLLTSVAAYGLRCSRAWDVVVTMGRKGVSDLPGTPQELYNSGEHIRYSFRGWDCVLWANSHESVQELCINGRKQILRSSGP